MSAVSEGLVSEDSAAERPNSRTHKRKETLLRLLTVLDEIENDREAAPGSGVHKSSFENDSLEHDQKVGSEAYYRFERKLSNFDKELSKLSDAARQLGSSVGVMFSVYELRERLSYVGYLFRENACSLFPRPMAHERGDPLYKPIVPSRGRFKVNSLPKVHRSMVFDPPDQEDFPKQLALLAQAVVTFLSCLNEFPEFTDLTLNHSIVSLEGDLKYWVSCAPTLILTNTWEADVLLLLLGLEAYDGRFRYPSTERYVHDLTGVLGEHFDSVSQAISKFVETGVPAIRFSQKHGANNLFNLSTIATFFSAVTATTLQFSYEMAGDGNSVADLVNGFWFTSLVFSIAAAVNSLLGLTWKQAMFRSPNHRVPWWVLIWMKRSPLVFLVLSVASFSVGLVLFTYASKQHHIVSVITTVFTALSSVGMITVSGWFAFERYAFTRHKGSKWLLDIFGDYWGSIESFLGDSWGIVKFLPPIAWTSRAWIIVKRIASRAFDGTHLDLNESFAVDSMHISPPPSHSERPSLSEHASLSPHVEISDSAPTGIPHRRLSKDTLSLRLPDSSDVLSEKDRTVAPDESTPDPGASSLPVITSTDGTEVTQAPEFVGKSCGESRTTAPPDHVLPKRQNAPPSSPSDAVAGPMHVAALSTKVQSLVPAHRLAAHSALVRHLQFSPNGKFLASSSWDRTSVISRVDNFHAHSHTIVHSDKFVTQLAWSPSGTMLLLKALDFFKVYTETGTCIRTIRRKHHSHFITWMPGGNAFLLVDYSADGDSVALVDLTGNELDRFTFGRPNMHIHEVSVTPDGLRMLGVGTLKASPDDSQPSRSPPEKRLFSYNFERKEIEDHVPTLNDVSGIAVDRSGQYALVSYRSNVPPELWQLETLRFRQYAESEDMETQPATAELAPATTSRFSLRQTYKLSSPADSVGPSTFFLVDSLGSSRFGGKDDELVLRVSKSGIHIWDRRSGSLLRYIRLQSSGDTTCIAWNPVANPYMFATGSHDGVIQVWTERSTVQAPPQPVAHSPGRSSPPVATVQRDRGLQQSLPSPTPVSARSAGSEEQNLRGPKSLPHEEFNLAGDIHMQTSVQSSRETPPALSGPLLPLASIPPAAAQAPEGLHLTLWGFFSNLLGFTNNGQR